MPFQLIQFPWRTLRETLTAHRSVWLGMGLVVLLSIYGQISVRRARYWVNHTFEVLDAVHQVESNLFSAQYALQEYLVDRSSLSRANYRQTVAALEQTLSALQILTADNPVQQGNIQRLKTLLDERLQEQQSWVQQPQKSSRPNRSKLVTDKLALLYTDGVQTQIVTIQQEERSLLQQRRDSVDREGSQASGILILGIGIAVMLSWRASSYRLQQAQLGQELNRRLSAIELEQDLSSHLLTCRTAEEAHDILQSFLAYLLPDCPGALYTINNSRDQMQPTVVFQPFSQAASCSPRGCWALRRGEIQYGQHAAFKVPCKLCRDLYPDGIPQDMVCIPLQAHEQTLGILHLSHVPTPQQASIRAFAYHISLPLAVLHLQSELEYLSFHDANTGIYNRRFLDEMLTRAIAVAQHKNHHLPGGAAAYGVGVIFMDVDHFKRFNSEYGHEAGDAVLRILGSVLKEITRAGEDVACRYGGEEFVLIMPGASEEVALAKAERIRQVVKQRPGPNGATITLSLGVAVYSQHGSTAQEVIKAANTALLRAKASGRDQVLVAN